MTEAAAAPAAPAAAPTNGAAAPAAPATQAPSEPLHAGGSFADFTQRVQQGMQARLKQSQPQPPPAAAPSPTEPAPAPTEQPPTETPADQPAEPTNTQVTPEDLELLAKAKAWLASDEIPAEFAQRLVALKNGDEIEYESLDEVRQGRMRQRDYTRAMQQHLQEKQQWQAAEGAYKAHFEAIFNDDNDGVAGGDAMYEIYTRAGKRKQLLAAATRLAREEQMITDAANGAGYAIMRRLGITDPNDYRVQGAVKREYARRHAEMERDARARAIAFENEQLRRGVQQRQREASDDQHFATQKKSLEQLRPRAFQALGLDHEDQNHRRHFNIYLGSIIRTEGLNRVTPELVMKAARAAREAVELQNKRLDADRGGAAGGGAKPAGFQRQLGPGGGAPAAAKPQQWSSETFAKQFKLPRW